MSICISVKVGEGLVFGADSVSVVTISGQVSGQQGVLNTYNYARKLSHLGNYPIGTLNWGISQIGARSIQSLLNEFERTIPRREDNPEYSVEDIAGQIYEFLLERYSQQFGEDQGASRPLLGIQVGGYSSDAFFPDQFVFQIPHSTSIERIRENNPDGSQNFGANWFGQTDAITRMYKGFDPRAVNEIAQGTESDQNTIREILQRFEYPVLFDGMPLQDAIDFVLWLISLVIGRFRFVIGVPTCAGDIDIAVIQPDEFTWVRRKSWHA